MGASLRVLLVVSPPLRSQAGAALERFGIPVTMVATCVEDAVPSAASMDLVVIAGSLPPLSMIDVSDAIRQHSPRARMVLLTGSDADRVRLARVRAECARMDAPSLVHRPGTRVSVAGPPRPAVGGGPRREGSPDAVVVASSTGGPEALTRFISGMSHRIDAPLLIVQHMPAKFTPMLAERLNALGVIPVREARDGDIPERGVGYLAPGDFHMTVGQDGRLAVGMGDPVQGSRPSADVLFTSAVRHWGPNILAVVLTGMGADGCDGAVQIHREGGVVLAQDEQSSVVWGMPGAVHRAGVASTLASPDVLGEQVSARVCPLPPLMPTAV